jgi:hypothetical protein
MKARAVERPFTRTRAMQYCAVFAQPLSYGLITHLLPTPRHTFPFGEKEHPNRENKNRKNRRNTAAKASRSSTETGQDGSILPILPLKSPVDGTSVLSVDSSHRRPARVLSSFPSILLGYSEAQWVPFGFSNNSDSRLWDTVVCSFSNSVAVVQHTFLTWPPRLFQNGAGRSAGAEAAAKPDANSKKNPCA